MSDQREVHGRNDLSGQSRKCLSTSADAKRAEIINRQLCHFYRADKELGTRIAAGLGVKIEMPTTAAHATV
ncbi:MAG TPA: hypothetical protein VFG32_08000 [Bacteroidota bacterium]|nr:hypothetical protein [Bacteroidota bacterium]